MKNRLFVIVILLASVSILTAQSFSIGPQVGFSKTNDADKATVIPSVAARLDLLGLGIEGSIGYKADKYYDGAVKVISYPVLVTGLLKILPILHGEAGIGWYNTKYDYSDVINDIGTEDDTKQKIGYHLGAGVSLPFGNVNLTGDLRYIFMNKETFDNLDETRTIKSDYYTIVIGLFFKL